MIDKIHYMYCNTVLYIPYLEISILIILTESTSLNKFILLRCTLLPYCTTRARLLFISAAVLNDQWF